MPNVTLIIAGEGPLGALLAQRARASGNEGRVAFVGSLPQSELGAYYRAADVFVFPSTSETQGLVLVEAMAHGLPVVAVDCAVSREVVAPGAGILAGESAQELSAAIVRVLSSAPDARARLVAAAIAAAAPYSIDSLGRRLEDLYAGALASLQTR